MNRRQFVFTVASSFLASLATAGAVLSQPKPLRSAADPQGASVTAVQDYLRLRAAKQWQQAHDLLSHTTQRQVPLAFFKQAKVLPADPTADGMTPTLTAMSLLFIDAADTQGYRYRVVGPVPGDPAAVLVDAQPPTKLAKSTLHLTIVTVTEPSSSGRPRLDMLKSMQQSDPNGCKHAAQWAKDQTKP